MRLYNITLFFHILGVVSMFGGFALLHRCGIMLRKSARVEEARNWVGLLMVTRGMFGAGAGILLITGIGLTAIRWHGPVPWIAVSLFGLLAIGIMGGAVAGRRIGELHALLEQTGANGPIPDEVSRHIIDPLPWVMGALANALALAIVWLMTTKPGWIESIGVVLVASALGALIGYRMVRRERDITVTASPAWDRR